MRRSSRSTSIAGARLALLAAALLVAVPAVPSPARAEPAPPVPTRSTARVAPTASAPVPYLPTPPVPGPVEAAPLPPQVEDAGAMDPRLAAAWAAAQAAGRAEGHPLVENSGYRPAALQQEVWDANVAHHGSPAAAHEFAMRPWESAHVRGLAIDVGPTVADQLWLEANQDRFGLCRRFENEQWHFELRRPEWTDGCLPLMPTAAHYVI